MQWHILYKIKDLPQYHITTSEGKYKEYLESLQKENATVIKCWTQDIFGKENILIDRS